MVTLEQVRQLESKIGKAIDYVSRVSAENTRLRGELEGSEKRLAGLDETVRRFREEQGRIEEGILAAMKRLDQFEDLISDGLSDVQAVVAAAAPSAPPRVTSPAEPDVEDFLADDPDTEGTFARSPSAKPAAEDFLVDDPDTEGPFAKSPPAKPAAGGSSAGPLNTEPSYDEPEDESPQEGETEELGFF